MSNLGDAKLLIGNSGLLLLLTIRALRTLSMFIRGYVEGDWDCWECGLEDLFYGHG